MNGERERIADQIRRSVNGDAWHGPSLGESLRGLSAEQALLPIVEGAPNVWAYALHCLCWMRWTRDRVHGEIWSITPAEDWEPPSETSEKAWENVQAELKKECEALAEAVARLTEEDLERTAPELNYTIGFMIAGVPQHNAYHAGQIMILRRIGGFVRFPV